MTTEKVYSRVGPKGQIVISKRLRDKYAIASGKQVEQIEVESGILIKPVSLSKDWERISERVAKRWPKKVSSVQAIMEDRERK